MRQHGYEAIATVYCSSQLGGARDLGEKRELAPSNLFCPYPESNSLWIVIAEKLADWEPLGRKISLFRSMAKSLPSGNKTNQHEAFSSFPPAQGEFASHRAINSELQLRTYSPRGSGDGKRERTPGCQEAPL